MARLAAMTRAGKWVAGFVAYEAAPAFDPALTAHLPDADHPLVWFGVYDAPAPPPDSCVEGASYRVGAWKALVDAAAYAAAVENIRSLIGAGDCYQVNHTFPMEAAFEGDAERWFEDLRAAQNAEHCAFVDTGRFAIVSASPELFFSLDGGRIRTRPMKGTRPRGRWPAEDRAQAEALKASPKERAENVMIVDLLRNDLGRIARTGTVTVGSLFDLERYPTVWQLTSAIEAETAADWTEVLATLFPSGSVTGAPKVRTMQIIRESEPHPRGVYCGAIGWAGPDGQASFNVAIRTATVDRESGRARYPVGGGITWDSATEAEYAECTHKARILTHRTPPFSLLETMRFEDGQCALLARHIARLTASAEYFGFRCEPDAIAGALDEAVSGRPGAFRVRLTVDSRGSATVDVQPAPGPRPFRVAWAPMPVDERDVFLYHKTTHREVYERARASAPGADAVLMLNSRGEVTEADIANLVVSIDGKRYTPPVECGLLEGVFRSELLARGEVETRVLTREMVRGASEAWLVNGLRGWIRIGEWI